MLSRMCNFYPRPPRGGRLIYQATTEDDRKFLSTPSARRATWTATLRRSFTKFLSTPSARRATVFVSPESSPGRNFYPRPPRGGRRIAMSDLNLRIAISIHALREEGDAAKSMWNAQPAEFLSTPSARRATPPGQVQQIRHVDFYPRPPRGGRRAQGSGRAAERNFYPRPPRGGRPSSGALPGPALKISIHALREEGDGSAGVGRSIELISIHALREEGDG